MKNVGRTWTYETACALGIEDTIDPNLPWNEYFEWFGPRYRLEVVENNMEDLNLKDGSLDNVRYIRSSCFSCAIVLTRILGTLFYSNCQNFRVHHRCRCMTSHG